jgi:hypothetical protein
MLSGFSVENYKAFARRQDIEIRPLTLFFGWNSGGKSALVRFLPLLAESIAVAGPPIWLGGAVGRKATWSELVCSTTERGNLKFALRWSEASIGAEWEILGDLEGRWQETTMLGLTTQGVTSIYARSEETQSWPGLLPLEASPYAQFAGMAELHAKTYELASSVQWVSGIRARPPRIVTYGGGAPATLRPDGEDCVDHLIAAQLRSTADPLLDIPRKFFAALGEQLSLDNPVTGAWRVLLQPSGASNVRVNLCDTGEGYSQVLPVLVALARACTGGPKIVCIEQPELHLHTSAQLELSKILIDVAKSDKHPAVLIETHSEVLLTSVQLAIANGELAPSDVRVYWVESLRNGTSDAISVDFDENGSPTNTVLASAFNEAIQLGQELITKQLKQ